MLRTFVLKILVSWVASFARVALQLMALEEAVGRIDDEGPIVRWVVLPCVRALLDVECPADGNTLADART